MVTSRKDDAFSSGGSTPGNQEDLALHVLHSLDQPICIIDADDRYLFVNKAYATLYGIGQESIRGLWVRDFVGEDFYNKRMRVLLERARQEGESEFLGWMDYPALGRRFVASDIRLYTYPGLVDKQCLIVQTRDKTDREELDQRRRKSIEVQEKVIGQAPAMIWIAGKEGAPYFYNESWLNFTGCTLVEQTRGGWFKLVHKDDRQLVEDRVTYAIDNREPVHVEFRLGHIMGEYRWVRLEGGPAEGFNGSNDDYIASSLDIHDLKLREEKMREELLEERHLRDQALKQKAKADRANREKSAYLSLASHEIRTPMNPVIGFADLLASNPDLDGDSKEMAQMILKAGKNLLTLIDEVLDYAKIEAGVLQLSPEPLDVHDLLIEIESSYAFDAKSRGIELKIEDKIRTKTDLYQDRLRLQQVLGTLISNAIKFTHTGEVNLLAKREKVRMNGKELHMLKFSVQDTGVGMTEEEIEELFKPFSRPETEFTDKYSGAGLGLAIAQKLVAAMRGTLTVESEQGKGTTVDLVIPFTPVPEHLRPALKRHDQEAEEVQKEAEKASIIIVDDEESSRQVNSSLMKFLGYACDVVDSGNELIDKLKERSYQMILMDIMMPGLDGLEATRKIRNGDCGEGNRDAYIVAVTVCSEDEDKERGLKAGINAYLTKPLTIHALRGAIGEYHDLEVEQGMRK
ncbi:MAG: ATP-binding protein [Puniceicoccaceae bacterium]